jgi:sugar phosphate isomerase/epimerase
MEFSLCIDSIYPEDVLKEKLEKIKQAGFKFIEFWDWRDKDYFLDSFQVILDWLN